MSGEPDDPLARARAHLQRASIEGLEAALALLEGAVQTSGLGDPDADSPLGRLRASLEEAIEGLRRHAPSVIPGAFSEPLFAALETEIARWEERSRNDPDARAVLRAFLGLRELLYELGLRREAPPPARGPREPKARAGRARPTRAAASGRERVQRFDVED